MVAMPAIVTPASSEYDFKRLYRTSNLEPRWVAQVRNVDHVAPLLDNGTNRQQSRTQPVGVSIQRGKRLVWCMPVQNPNPAIDVYPNVFVEGFDAALLEDCHEVNLLSDRLSTLGP
jgi:hypothetical protein